MLEEPLVDSATLIPAHYMGSLVYSLSKLDARVLLLILQCTNRKRSPEKSHSFGESSASTAMPSSSSTAF